VIREALSRRMPPEKSVLLTRPGAADAVAVEHGEFVRGVGGADLQRAPDWTIVPLAWVPSPAPRAEPLVAITMTPLATMVWPL